MSIESCFYCGERVDTDDAEDCYVTIGRPGVGGQPLDVCACQSCLEERFRWCEQGSHWVDPDEYRDEAEMCLDCTETAADALHDAMSGDR